LEFAGFVSENWRAREKYRESESRHGEKKIFVIWDFYWKLEINN
jgi:hypothetical protein